MNNFKMNTLSICGFLFFLSVAVASDTLTALANDPRCGKGGYRYSAETGSCYKVHREKLAWHDAQLACVAEGALLAVLDNTDEANYVKDIYSFSEHNWVSIGIYDYTGNNNWISVDWRPVGQIYNVWVGSSSREAGYDAGRFHKSGKLDFGINTYGAPFICESKSKI